MNQPNNEPTNQPTNKHDGSQYVLAEVIIIVMLCSDQDNCNRHGQRRAAFAPYTPPTPTRRKSRVESTQLDSCVASASSAASIELRIERSQYDGFINNLAEVPNHQRLRHPLYTRRVCDKTVSRQCVQNNEMRDNWSSVLVTRVRFESTLYGIRCQLLTARWANDVPRPRHRSIYRLRGSIIRYIDFMSVHIDVSIMHLGRSCQYHLSRNHNYVTTATWHHDEAGRPHRGI